MLTINFLRMTMVLSSFKDGDCVIVPSHVEGGLLRCVCIIYFFYDVKAMGKPWDITLKSTGCSCPWVLLIYR